MDHNIKEVIDNILEAIEIRIKKNNNSLKFDRTLIGQVIEIGSKKYKVKINDEESLVRVKEGIVVNVGDFVIIKVPNNDYSLKYIDGKLK